MWSATASLLLLTASLLADSPEIASGTVNFAREVRPLLANRCLHCHGRDEAARQANLRLDTFEGSTVELPSGAVAVRPGKPEQSELVSRIAREDPELRMPPLGSGKPLSVAEQALLRRWIEQGAEYAPHWAYVRPQRPSIPLPSDATSANPIDALVRARLNREGLSFKPPADKPTLLRRVAFDLTGLPPSQEEMTEFLADDRPDAFQRAVDRLLMKPAYGERWGAMWLDLARYADSSGYIHDPPRSIWRWRDWLIESLNKNTPYDRFTIEMVAGDLLPNATIDEQLATGFHRNTTTNTEGGANAGEYQFAAVVDRVNTTMQVWMGSTFACAQCHDHKYDPFTQRDYYQLFAVFNSTVDYNSETPTLEVPRIAKAAEFEQARLAWLAARNRLEESTLEREAAFEEWLASVDGATLPADVADAFVANERTPAQLETLRLHHRRLSSEWVELEQSLSQRRAELDEVSATSLVMKEGERRPTRIALRGEYGAWGDEVMPAVPGVFHSLSNETPMTRLELARWLVDESNPLTARVAVNRLWQELFGVGIVETSEEFGLQGELPSHPELLDWLAVEYMQSGWDTKHLLRTIVGSATYQQSSDASLEEYEADPQNRLLARGPRVRLSAEAIRDQALSVSGLLSNNLYGPPAHPYQPVSGLPAAFGASTDWSPTTPDDAHRRAVYTRWRRNLPYPSFLTFDVPERAVCSARRIRTNTPIQALVTLNDPVYVEAAQALARRIMAQPGETPQEKAAVAVELVLMRPARDEETERLVSLYTRSHAALAKQPERALALATKPHGPLPNGLDVTDAAAWTVVANVLLNLDETFTKR